MKRSLIIFGIITAMTLSGCASVKTDNSVNSVEVISAGDYSALDGTGSGWGFVRKKGAPPEIPSAQASMLEKYNGRYIDHSKEKNLYLTFDEGYENGFTARILDILAKTDTPAAFFVTGPYLEGQGELIKRMIDEGHIVGNHTVHH
ncbi:MAG: polysaccharide deacetylase family protein, partial [Candidatus Ornithomonoglobus sp.]